MRSTMSRRAFVAASGTTLTVPLVGCLSDEEEPTGEHSCPEAWNVILYNEFEEARSVELTILDSEDQVVFSDTVDLDPNTDRSTGVELDVEVYYDQSYTFEAELSAGDAISNETSINCGDVYIFVTESSELDLRAEEADH